jgi:toxin ParE1/3/4
MEIIIAPKARSDIASILAWTQENFGPQTMNRYSKLIQTAIEEIGEDPKLAGSTGRLEIGEHCRTYHLCHSRKKAGRVGGKIRHPRHFLLYRVTETNVVEIGRVLHDSMELEAHIPEDYRRPPEE